MSLSRGCRVFDADNHYYEAEDALTRHLDPKLPPRRTIPWAEINGKKKLLVAGTGFGSALPGRGG